MKRYSVQKLFDWFRPALVSLVGRSDHLTYNEPHSWARCYSYRWWYEGAKDFYLYEKV